ncbi:MAG: FlgD immunoglobulin-like domain containing protein [Cytophagaceae bacterium]
MNRRIRHQISILFTVVICLLSSVIFAQVEIKDQNFKEFIQTTYPTVITAEGKLDTNVAKTITGSFHCVSRNVTDISGIKYFTGITKLRLFSNKIETVPAEINQLTQLTDLILDSNQIKQLPDLSNLVNLEILQVRENELTSLPSLNSFTKLKRLFIDNNNITSLPSLDNLISLDHFICSDNPLGRLPDMSKMVKLRRFICISNNLTQLPSFKGCISLEELLCDFNQIKTFPEFEDYHKIKEIKMQYNQLEHLPDLSLFPNLISFDIRNNRLSFEDIIPISNHPNFGSFQITNQSVGKAETVNIKKHEKFIFTLSVDEHISNNEYKWYKNGQLIATTSINKLEIPKVTSDNEGEYSCIITNNNPKYSAIRVSYAPKILSVLACMNAHNFKYNLTDNTCTYPIGIKIDESSIEDANLPLKYIIKSSFHNQAYNSPEFKLPKEGVYDVIIQDVNECEVLLNSAIKIDRNPDCDPVFYPNGDGIADSYYISESGTCKIFNRQGKLIKTLSIPAEWDGTDDAGQPAPSGLYLLEVNKSTSIKVSLMR